VFLGQLMDTDVEVVHVDDDLNEVLRKMDTKQLFAMPVINNNKFIGLVSKARLLDQYRKEIKVQTDQ